MCIFTCLTIHVSTLLVALALVQFMIRDGVFITGVPCRKPKAFPVLYTGNAVTVAITQRSVPTSGGKGQVQISNRFLYVFIVPRPRPNLSMGLGSSVLTPKWELPRCAVIVVVVSP